MCKGRSLTRYLPHRGQWSITSPGLHIRQTSTFPDLPIFRALASHDPKSYAIVHSKSQRKFTYGGLLRDVESAKIRLYQQLKTAVRQGEPVGGQRVAFLIENNYDYVVTLLSIFACDGIAVPLSPSYPVSELRYVVENSGAATLLATNRFMEQAKAVLQDELEPAPTLNKIEKLYDDRGEDEVRLIKLPWAKGGMMLYTSGTTSRPKGVLLSAENLAAQTESLCTAWKYSSKDHLLHILPLHHIHGTVNALLTPLVAGSTIEFLYPFNTDAVWNRLALPFMFEAHQSHRQQNPVTFLTAVPAMYNRLVSSYQTLSLETQAAGKKALEEDNMRLNISGSAALPVPLKDSWSKLSGGNILLERYGMTEVGMALSCGLSMQDRVDGSVGWPLPSVDVRLVEAETGHVIQSGEEIDDAGNARLGEVQLRGPTVFQKYWKNEEATAAEFVKADDGGEEWFKTGDVAFRKSISDSGVGDQDWAHGPCYFVQGRMSTDIIKTGGEKVSALEVERELLSLPRVEEAVVLGIANQKWGQKVCAVVVLNDSLEANDRGAKPWSVLDMRRALKDRLAAQKIPQELKVVAEIPKNAMGKVNKKTLAQHLFSSDT